MERALAIEAALVILLCVAGQIVSLAADKSDNANGYDHPAFNSLLYDINQIRSFGDGPFYFNNADPKTLLFRLTARAAQVFGLGDAAVFALPMIGLFLVIFFGYKLGRRLGESPTAGWLAAATLVLSPFVFGLARRFTPWTLTLGLFLAIVHFALKFREDPSFGRMAALLAAVIVGGRLPHETTSRIMFDFFTVATLAWVFIRILPSYWPSKKKPVVFLYGAILLIIIAASITGVRHQASYLMHEGERFQAARGVLQALPGYFVDLWRNTLGPAGSIAFLALLAAFPFLHKKREDLFWFLLILAVFAGLTIIPKKNSWYLFEVLALGGVLSGVALYELARRLGRFGAPLLVTAFLAALSAQYVSRSFTSWDARPPAAADMMRYMNSVDPVAFPVRGSEGTYRAKIDLFKSEFPKIFGAAREIRLGLILNIDGYELAPFYLRKSGLPLKLYLAVQPDAPELGRGLDAVLVMTHGKDDFLDSILGKPQNFYQIFVTDALRYTPLERDARSGLFEDLVDKRREEWNAADHRFLGDGMMLILPGKNENPIPAED